MPQRLPPALQERDFRFLWSAIFSMRFAENMIAVAVGWQVFAIHKDPLDLGLIGLAEFVPLLLLALPAGHLADRLPRRLVGALALAVMVGVAAALLVVTVEDAQVVWPYFLLASLTGAASAIGWPAYQALTPEVVPTRPGAGRGRAPLGCRPDRGDRRPGGRRPALRVEVGGGLRNSGGALRGRRDLDGGPAGPTHVVDAPLGFAGLVGGVRFVWRTRMLLGAITLDLFAVLVGGGWRSCRSTRARSCTSGRWASASCAQHPQSARSAPPSSCAAAAPRRRPDVHRSRRPLRRGQRRLGSVEVAAAHAGGARRRRLRRHVQRQHPVDHGRAGHTERAACPASNTR